MRNKILGRAGAGPYRQRQWVEILTPVGQKSYGRFVFHGLFSLSGNAQDARQKKAARGKKKIRSGKFLLKKRCKTGRDNKEQYAEIKRAYDGGSQAKTN